jgi:hypothetical protein
MLSAADSMLPLRFGRLKFGLLVLTLTALLLPATARAQCSTSGSTTTCTSTDVISTPDEWQYYTGTNTNPYSTGPYKALIYPSQMTVTGAGGPVVSLQITLKGITSKGNNNSSGQQYGSVWGTEIMLVSPSNQELEIFGEVGDGADGPVENQENEYGDLYACSLSGSPVCGLEGLNVTVADVNSGNSPMPGNGCAPTGDPNCNEYGSSITGTAMPQTGSDTWDPTSYNSPEPYPTGPSPTTPPFPQSNGSATLASIFTGATSNGTWQLYMMDQNGDPVTINGWTLALTVNETIVGTSTQVSSSLQPSYTSGASDTPTFTATVTPQSGTVTPTGTVAFYANGSGSPVTCSSGDQTVNGSGQATCATTLTTQGINTIKAVYTPTGSFSTSNGSADQLVEVHAAPSGTQWCNSGSAFTIPSVSGGAPIQMAYPSVIGVSGVSQTVADLTVELNNVVTSSVGLLEDSFLLVAPNGQNLEFLGGGWTGSSGGTVTLTFEDDAGQSVPPADTPPTSGSYIATDNSEGLTAFPAISPSASSFDSGIPAIPATIHYAQPEGGTTALNFEGAFSGSPADGEWALYILNDGGGSDYAPITVGGWCVDFTLNTGVATTTTLSSSANPALTGNAVTLTATVTGGSPTAGSVNFIDTTTNTTLASNVALNGSGQASVTTSALTEGDHYITASYSGVTSEFDPSSTSKWQREDHATTASGAGTSVSPAVFCNPGGIKLAGGEPPNNSGQSTPNPSNIFVANLPGTVSSVGVELENLQTAGEPIIFYTSSLLVGPTGTGLDFFSETGASNTVITTGNYIFNDSAGSLVPQTASEPAGTYRPTSYAGSGGDTFFASPSGFYTLPGTFDYAATKGSSTFDGLYGTTNPNGTWSLYFNQALAIEQTTAGATAWCLDFVETPPTVSATLPGTSSFSQSQQDASFEVNIESTGPGSTGDPTAGSNPLTLTDTLASGFTYSTFSGTGWNCSANGQVVTCTNDSSVADGDSYNSVTIDVNVSGSAEGTIDNSVTVSGAGVASTGSNTDAVTIQQVPASIVIDGSQTQSALAGTAFGSLAVTVKDGGGAVIPSYSSVVFTAPGSGASGTFSNTTNTISIPTNGSGVADPGVFTANATGGGPYSVTVTAGAASTSFNLTNTQTTPTINWTPATTIIFGSAGTTNVLNASASCGGGCGTITYTASGVSGNITSTTALAASSTPYTITANFTPSLPQYAATSATSPLTVSGESVWIVNSNASLGELAGNGYEVGSYAGPFENVAVAIDNGGNVWTVGPGSTPLYETTQVGTQQNTISSGTGGLDLPAAIAIDGNGQVWVTNGNSSVSLFSNGGSALSPSTGFTDPSLSTPSGIAIDLGGSVWIANTGNNSVTRILGAAAPVAPLSTATANNSTGAKP